MEQLRMLQSRYTVIGDIRGCGLYLGIEFIQVTSRRENNSMDDDNATIIPHGELTKYLVDHLMDHRVIVSRDGPATMSLRSSLLSCSVGRMSISW
jgi:4-aminobutyrate aminotransferase-like enzyme